ncbi:MAG: nuclear transport factor 2 family protein [bacterium]|jgi:hypothetical protein
MKKFINYSLAAMITLVLLSANNVNGQTWSKEQKAVWEVVQKGWDDYVSGDVEKAFSGVHEMYLGWNAEEPLPVSKESWIKEYNRWKEHVSFDYYDLKPASITVIGESAIVYYYFEFVMTFHKDEMKKTREVKGKNVEFYVKDGGQWMLLGDMTHYKETGN